MVLKIYKGLYGKLVQNIPGYDAKEKYELSELKSSLDSGLKYMVWSKIYFINVGVGKLLLVKCSQALNN